MPETPRYVASAMVLGMPPRLQVVLVEPAIPENVGAVARLVANFGATDWTVVNAAPFDGHGAEKTACMALDALRSARLVGTLAEAVGDCTHVIGFTARVGRERVVRPLERLGELRADLPEGASVALVFGREDRGLEDSEVQLCSDLITIPTAGLASLNLSHAVAISLYAWFHDQLPCPGAPSPHPVATLADRTRLAAEACRVLTALDFIGDERETVETLRRSLTQQPLQSRDARIWWKLFRHIDPNR